MICGPTIPNTRHGLRDLLVQRIDLVEHGLSVLATNLVLGQDATVDVLACDAAGAPVLLFLAVPETAAGLAARTLGAQSWWRKNAGALSRELAAPDLRSDRTPRLMVVGLDILADTLEELRRAHSDALTVAQFCSFTLGGRLRLGVSTLYPVELESVVAPDAFQVPPGITEPDQRDLASRFMDLARRVDVGMAAEGGRFHRRLSLGGRAIAELGLVGGRLKVDFPALSEGFAQGCPIPAQTFQLDSVTCLAAVDRMLRLALAIEAGEVRGLGSDPDLAIPVEPVEVPAEESEQPPVDAAAPEVPANAESRFSLEPIRRSVARAQLSREEFSALGEERSDT